MFCLLGDKAKVFAEAYKLLKVRNLDFTLKNNL